MSDPEKFKRRVKEIQKEERLEFLRLPDAMVAATWAPPYSNPGRDADPT